MRLGIIVVLCLAALGCDASTDGTGTAGGGAGDGKGDGYDWGDDDQDRQDDRQDQDVEQDCGGQECQGDGEERPPAETGEAQDAEVEPNDDAEHATFLGSPNCSGEAELDGDDDTDWFSVRIESSGEVTFSTHTGDPDDDEATDTRIEVYSANDLERPLSTDDDAGEGHGSRLAIALDPGLVLIKVLGYTTATAGSYTISALKPGAEAGDPDDEEEPVVLGQAQEVETESNGIAGAADSMGTAPSSIAATLDARDVDWFAFQVDAPRTITIETAPLEDGGEGVDTVVELFDAIGAESYGSDDDGSELRPFSRLQVDLPAAGIYTVRVDGYLDSTHGAYTLSID